MPCNSDSDGDGVQDGYEFKSAQDLNDDEYQQPNTYLPYPGKRPYPNPLFADAGVDYDGDTLTLGEEYRCGRRRHPHADPLYYSDGEQYSISRRIASGPDAGRREPTWPPPTYNKRTEFINWASAHGYRQVELPGRHALVRHRRAQHATGCSTSTAAGTREHVRALLQRHRRRQLPVRQRA